MTRYVLRRLGFAVLLSLLVATLVFVLLESAPGSPADIIIGERPLPAAARARIEHAYGFDRPPAERYLHWIGALFLEGELGWSQSRGRPVAQAIAEALPPTVLLTGCALLVNLVLGVLIGVVSAARRGRLTDRLLSGGGLLLYAMPPFWLGLMAILGLSYGLHLFPASSTTSVGAADWDLWRRVLDRAWHLALPAGVLGLASAAAMARFVRAGVLDNLGRQFVSAARARGATPARVLWAHALRNALLPVINLVGLSLPVLLSGSLVTEVVFAWPGMGRLTYDAIRAQDFPVVMATTLMATLMVVVGNLLADLAMLAADPRIRLGGGGGDR